MKNLFQKIIFQVSDLITDKCSGCCVSILDEHGNQILYFTLGSPTPCSYDFSYKKALTTYNFRQNSDEIYESLKDLGGQSLINGKFCFISGGVIATDNSQKHYYLGVSTDVPSIDKEIALEISNLIHN